MKTKRFRSRLLLSFLAVTVALGLPVAALLLEDIFAPCMETFAGEISAKQMDVSNSIAEGIWAEPREHGNSFIFAIEI